MNLFKSVGMGKEGMSIWGNARVRSYAIKIAAGSRVDISGTLSFFKGTTHNTGGSSTITYLKFYGFLYIS